MFDAWKSAYSAEPVQFGIDDGTIEPFLSERGLRLIEQLNAQDMERRFLTVADGSLAGRVVDVFGLVHAQVGKVRASCCPQALGVCGRGLPCWPAPRRC